MSNLKQSLHRGGARLIGSEAFWIASYAWSDWPSDTWFGVSPIVTLFSKAIRFVDLLRLEVCFALAARKSLYCSAKKALLCIATLYPLIIWSNARFVGLLGLCERRWRSAFIEDACLSNWLRFWWVFSENSLPLLPSAVLCEIFVYEAPTSIHPFFHPFLLAHSNHRVLKSLS